jgi:DNA helicase-2/ATP-dependent DNA helicase PcrA
MILFEGETERDEAELRQPDRRAPSASLAPRDLAVFYRPTPSRACWKTRRGREISPHRRRRHAFFDRTEIKDLVCYLRAIGNPDDGLALQRIINVPARGIGAATVDKIGEIIYERKIPAWKALELVAQDEGLLGSGPRKKVAAFVALMTRLRAEGAALGPASLAEKILEESGYRDALASDATMESEGRIENLLELVAQMREYEKEAEEPTLHGFLERIALVSDVDGYDPEKGAISLMTVQPRRAGVPGRLHTGLLELDLPPRAQRRRRLCRRRSGASVTSRSRARGRSCCCRACAAAGCRARSCPACRAGSCAICRPGASRRS